MENKTKIAQTILEKMLPYIVVFFDAMIEAPLRPEKIDIKPFSKLAPKIIQDSYFKEGKLLNFITFSKFFTELMSTKGFSENRSKYYLKDLYINAQNELSDEIIEKMDNAKTVRAFDLDRLEYVEDEVCNGDIYFMDIELLEDGIFLSSFYIEAGTTKFIDVAKSISNDLDSSLQKIRPFLHFWYNGARDILAESGFDVANMDSIWTIKESLAAIDAEIARNL